MTHRRNACAPSCSPCEPDSSCPTGPTGPRGPTGTGGPGGPTGPTGGGGLEFVAYKFSGFLQLQAGTPLPPGASLGVLIADEGAFPGAGALIIQPEYPLFEPATFEVLAARVSGSATPPPTLEIRFVLTKNGALTPLEVVFPDPIAALPVQAVASGSVPMLATDRFGLLVRITNHGQTAIAVDLNLFPTATLKARI